MNNNLKYIIKLSVIKNTNFTKVVIPIEIVFYKWYTK